VHELVLYAVDTCAVYDKSPLLANDSGDSERGLRERLHLSCGATTLWDCGH